MKRSLLFCSALYLVSLAACTHPTIRETSATTEAPNLALQDFATLQATEKSVLKDPIHASRLYSHGEKTKRSVLVMHGLHESPEYMKGLCEFYEKHGYNVFSLLLPGHQLKDREGLNKVQYTEWIQAAEKGFQIAKDLGEEVEVAGYSTGGTLAMYLALAHPAEVKRITLISPALALSNKVFFSSSMLGHSSIDAGKICKKVDARNAACRVLKLSDAQIEPMLKEGLLTSAAAGLQVQNLIQAMLVQSEGATAISSEQEPDHNYYEHLKENYLRVRIPMVMINTENDNVVHWKFNSQFAKAYHGPKAILLYPKKEGVTHLTINKSGLDCFKNSPQICNPHFDQILSTIESLP